jgi:hypothetical protein
MESHLIPITQDVSGQTLRDNIRKIEEFDESNFDRIYDAALRSISKGRDLGRVDGIPDMLF